MLGIITIPHSSAHCERVFSTVRKNRTDQRSSLNDKTLESLLVLKGRTGKPDSRHHDIETLKRLKRGLLQITERIILLFEYAQGCMQDFYTSI